MINANNHPFVMNVKPGRYVWCSCGESKANHFVTVPMAPPACVLCLWKSPKKNKLPGADVRPLPESHSATGHIKKLPSRLTNQENCSIGKKIMGKGDFTLGIKGAFPLNGDGALSTKIPKIFDT